MDKKKASAFLMALALLLLLAGAALAGSAGGYTVGWQVLAGGGAPALAGQVALNGTLGQPVAGLSASGSYNISGGYWYRGSLTPPPMIYYLPFIIKDQPQ